MQLRAPIPFAPLPRVWSDVPVDAVPSAALARLDADGFVVLPAVLDPGEVERLRRAFVGPGVAGTAEIDVTPETPDADAWLRLATSPLTLAAAWHLLRRPFEIRWLRGRNPRRGLEPQALHRDGPLMTLLFMLDDFGDDNGATRVVPRSHRAGAPPPPYANPLARHPEERPATGEAGSVLIFGGRLWHRAPGNPSGRPRRTAMVQAAAADQGDVKGTSTEVSNDTPVPRQR